LDSFGASSFWYYYNKVISKGAELAYNFRPAVWWDKAASADYQIKKHAVKRYATAKAKATRGVVYKIFFKPML